MDQRALLASLVLGCVTAAGAGGYLAVRQMAPAPVPDTPTVTVPAPDPTEGTVADLGAGTPSADAPPVETPAATAPAPSLSTRQADIVSGPAPVRAPAARPAPASRPAASSSASVQPPAPTPAAPAQATTAARDVPPRDTWPAPAADAQAPDTRWPARDREPAATAEASLPSRPAVSEPVDAPVPLRRLENVTIPADAVIGVQLETTVNSERAKVEDQVRARVTRDVLANGSVVIPAGTRMLGNVTLVEDGGRIKERARLGVRFHTLVFANGMEVRLPTETVYREGDAVAGRAAAKIGGAAIGGAIVGAIMGGGKGAVIGAATGAGSGTGWAMAGDRKPAELRSGQSVTVRVSETVMTQIER